MILSPDRVLIKQQLLLGTGNWPFYPDVYKDTLFACFIKYKQSIFYSVTDHVKYHN